MTALTLFEIAQEYRQITDVLQDTACDEQTLADTLEGERWPLELKAQNYGFVIGNKRANAAAIREHAKRMIERADAEDRRADHLQEHLKTCMEVAGVTELSCPHFAIKIRKNPPSVDVWDEKQIPAEFMRTPEPKPVVATPDKKAIAAAIKAGTEIPGAKLVQGTALVIK